MEQLVSYEYCLKERIGKAVEFFESHGIDMELEKNSEMKKTVDRRRQFFSVDKDISTCNGESDLESIYKNLSRVCDATSQSTLDVEYFWSCTRDILIAIAIKAGKAKEDVIKVLALLLDNNTEGEEYKHYMQLIEEKNEEFLSDVAIDKKKRQVSRSLGVLEESVCGLTQLEQWCEPEMTRIIEQANDIVEEKGLLDELRSNREKLQSVSHDVPDPLKNLVASTDTHSEESFVATSSFPAVKRPSRASSVPRETYVFPRETRRRRRWTAEEESRLTQGVHTYGEGQWAAIRRHMRLTSRSNVEIGQVA
ncbi:hypothetical protein WA588_004854 [Blastocystis sp. NMH]